MNLPTVLRVLFMFGPTLALPPPNAEPLGLRDKTFTGIGNNDRISWFDKHLQNSSRSFVSKSLALS